MSITHTSPARPGLNDALAAMLRRLARWIETPSTPRREKTRGLPRALADAEDWLLDDLGLIEPDDRLPRHPSTDRQAKR